jgi:hypothetical protein
MRRAAALAICLSGLGFATLAAAQEEQQPEPEPEPEVEVEPPATQPMLTPLPEDEGPIPEPNVPEDPLAGLPPDEGVEAELPRYDKRGYPIERVKRPLTLPADLGEIDVDVPMVLNDGHPLLTQTLSPAYGITVDLELGLTYSIGVERLSAEPGEQGFEVGRAVSLDAAYTLIPRYLAVQARLAFYIDPDVFGIGLILGLPYKIELGDEWAIFGGADLERLRLKEFAVYPEDPAANLFNVSEIGRGVEPGIGSGRLTTGVMFQARPDTAIDGSFGVERNFESDDQDYSLFAGVTYSPSPAMDLAVHLGFRSLDSPEESFTAALRGALRF